MNSLIFFGIFLPSTFALFENCDYSYNVDSNLTIESGQYLTPPYNCRMSFFAPKDHILSIKCSVYFSPYTYQSSYHDCVKVNGNGNMNLDKADTFYGSCSLSKESTFDYLYIAFLSTDSYVSYKCDVTTKYVGCECGWSMVSKISAGSSIPANKFPSMAVITKDGKPHCGGTIISKTAILSAAHCYYQLGGNYANLEVILGENNLSSTVNQGYRQTFKVSKIIWSPDYDDRSLANDIAIIKLASYILWSSCVAPICLPFLYTYATFSGQPASICGFGSTAFASPSSKLLLEGKVNVIENSICSSSFEGITDSNICAEPFNTPNSENLYPDACQMDSGGPLFWIYNGRCYLIGIISFGKYCGLNHSSVYTRVSKFLDWIVKETGGQEFCHK